MAAITGGSAKELLRLGRKSVLQLVIEEAREAGVDRIVVVSSREKPDLTAQAERMGATVVFQERPEGLADAIVSADVSDEALVLNGDTVFHGGAPSYRMAALVRRAIPGCIAVEAVDDEGTRRYGIVEVDEGTGAIRRVLEKPGPEGTASRWAISARYAFGPAMMAFIERYRVESVLGEGQELTVTPILDAAVQAGFDLKAVPIQPGQQRLGCGDPAGYRTALGLDWS